MNPSSTTRHRQLRQLDYCHVCNLVAEQSKEEKLLPSFRSAARHSSSGEHVMTDVLLRRGVIKEEGDSFNQKEAYSQPTVPRGHERPRTRCSVCIFTFHLKDVSNYVDNGNGGKVLDGRRATRMGERNDDCSHSKSSRPLIHEESRYRRRCQGRPFSQER